MSPLRALALSVVAALPAAAAQPVVGVRVKLQSRGLEYLIRQVTWQPELALATAAAEAMHKPLRFFAFRPLGKTDPPLAHEILITLSDEEAPQTFPQKSLWLSIDHVKAGVPDHSNYSILLEDKTRLRGDIATNLVWLATPVQNAIGSWSTLPRIRNIFSTIPIPAVVATSRDVVFIDQTWNQLGFAPVPYPSVMFEIDLQPPVRFAPCWRHSSNRISGPISTNVPPVCPSANSVGAPAAQKQAVMRLAWFGP